jgi:hypothetical protein
MQDDHPIHQVLDWRMREIKGCFKLGFESNEQFAAWMRNLNAQTEARLKKMPEYNGLNQNAQLLWWQFVGRERAESRRFCAELREFGESLKTTGVN